MHSSNSSLASVPSSSEGVLAGPGGPAVREDPLHHNHHGAADDRSHSSTEGGCFFADATLEDAHHLVDSPVGPSTNVNVIRGSDVDASAAARGGLYLNPPAGAAKSDASATGTNADEPIKGRRINGDGGAVGTSSSSRSARPIKRADGAEKDNVPERNGSAAGESPLMAAAMPDREERTQTKEMSRITNMDIVVGGGGDSARIEFGMTGGGGGPGMLSADPPIGRRRPPRVPRDIGWAVYALVFIPVSLLLPYYLKTRYPERYSAHDTDSSAHVHGASVPVHGWSQAALSSRGHVATFITALLAYGAACVLARMMYRNPVSGGDGEDDRHFAASQVVLISHYVALVAYPTLLALLYTEFPHADTAPLWTLCLAVLFVRDFLILRRTFRDDGRGRRIFFKTLVCVTLDILSRSLRRMSLYRIVCGLLFLQLVVVVMWRSALFLALSIPTDTNVSFVRGITILLVLLGGKWATGIVARTLGFIASGGITVWFAQQSSLLEEVHGNVVPPTAVSRDESVDTTENNGSVTANNRGTVDSEDDDDEDALSSGGSSAARSKGSSRARSHATGASSSPGRTEQQRMPEAYRSVDANVYRSVNDMDDSNVFHDDESEPDEDQNVDTMEERPHGRGRMARAASSLTVTDWTTARGFLIHACTISFGSVAQCGLLGGFAQFVWSCIRNADVARVQHEKHVRGSASSSGGGVAGGSGHNGTPDGFRGMEVSTSGGDDDARTIIMTQLGNILMGLQRVACTFVQTHSDLAMSHVAAYFKSYQRAAMDVSALVEASGVEPIIHDDISTAMCASLGVAISGCIVVVVGVALSHYRGYLSDTVVCDILVISFVMSYTIVFTVMEPLRASIKAIYVCFAQRPEALSQAFPLVFHRLTRISETNVHPV